MIRITIESLLPKDRRIWAPALANVIVAAGGAAVLGRFMDVVQVFGYGWSSLSAFFVGTTLGLGFLFKFGKDRILLLVPIAGATTSLVSLVWFLLFSEGHQVLDHAGVVFFFLLATRFGFWFLSRVVRSNAVSKIDSSAIPMVEGFFHLGTILSLALGALGILNLSFAGVLVMDSVAQLIGYLADRCSLTEGSGEKPSNVDQFTENNDETRATIEGRRWLLATYVQSVATLAILTIATQVIVFHMAHRLSAGLGIVASFYGGLAAAGILGAKLGIEPSELGLLGGVKLTKLQVNIPNQLLLLLALSPIATVLLAPIEIEFQVVLVFLSSVAYEILFLAALARAATSAEDTGIRQGVSKAMAWMVMTANIAIFGLEALHPNLENLVVAVIALFCLSAITSVKTELLIKTLREIWDRINKIRLSIARYRVLRSLVFFRGKL